MIRVMTYAVLPLLFLLNLWFVFNGDPIGYSEVFSGFSAGFIAMGVGVLVTLDLTS